MRAHRYLQAFVGLAGVATGLLRSSVQVESSVQATKEIAGQPTTHSQRRPESLAGRLVAPDDIPAKQKASDPYQVATAAGNVTFSNDLGLQTSEPDAGVGLKPLFILFVAGIFFLLLVAVCVILPRLQGVTLGIAGTLEDRYSRPDLAKSIE